MRKPRNVGQWKELKLERGNLQSSMILPLTLSVYLWTEGVGLDDTKRSSGQSSVARRCLCWFSRAPPYRCSQGSSLGWGGGGRKSRAALQVTGQMLHCFLGQVHVCNENVKKKFPRPFPAARDFPLCLGRHASPGIWQSIGVNGRLGWVLGRMEDLILVPALEKRARLPQKDE